MFSLNFKKISLCVGMMTSFYFSQAKAIETVLNLNDKGTGSFTQALIDVDQGGVINFNEELNGTISVLALQLVKSCTINGNSNVIIDGGGTFKHQPWNSNLFQVSASNITIKNLNLQNSTGPNAWDGHGVILTDGLENITFENCSFNNNKQSGLTISDWVPTPGTEKGIKNLTLINCTATGNVLNGIQIVRTNGLTISGGEYHDNQQSGIFLERGVINAFIDSVKIYGNGLPSTGNTNANVGVGIRVYDGGSISNQQSKKITITNSKIHSNNVNGLEFSLDSDSIHVFRNEIYNNGKGTSTGSQACGIAFQFGGSDNCIVAENNIYDNLDAGIYMYRLDPNPSHTGNIFHKNTLDNNGGGIILFGAKNAIVSENTVLNTTIKEGVIGGLNGIFLGDASDNSIISQNTVKNSQNGAGIYISDQSTASNNASTKNVYIIGNTVIKNSNAGIRIQNSSEIMLGKQNPTVPQMIATIVNPITTKTIGSLNSTLVGQPNVIKENQTGVWIKKSTNVSISQDSIYCNNQNDKIIYENVKNVIHTTIQSNEIMVEKIGDDLTLKNLQTVTDKPIQLFLFETSTCTDSKYNYIETKSLDTQGNLTVKIPNLGTIDSLLLFVTNVEGNTFSVVADLSQIVTANDNISQNSIVTYTQNELFVIENGQNSKVIVSNSNGVIINKYDNINELEIGNNLTQGMYLIHIESSIGESFTKKYIKL